MKHVDDAARLAAVVFAMKRWEWYIENGQRVPNEEDIAQTIREFLTDMSRDGRSSHSSGRITVEWNEDFDQYEIMLEVGRISSRELWTEEGIDHFVTMEEE